jgi:hypothetical protein
MPSVFLFGADFLPRPENLGNEFLLVEPLFSVRIGKSDELPLFPGFNCLGVSFQTLVVGILELPFNVDNFLCRLLGLKRM